jgi:hypothetical protein
MKSVSDVANTIAFRFIVTFTAILSKSYTIYRTSELK